MPTGWLIGLGFIISLMVVLIMTPLVKKLAFKIGAVDKPNYRKVHTTIMPRLGGLAIYIAFALGCLFLSFLLPEGFLRPFDLNLIYALLSGSTLIVILGVLDDCFELSAKVKLVAQIGVACMVVFGFDVSIVLVNMPFGENMQPIAEWLGIPLTILWIVGVTNAINLIDGLDGLAAGVSGIAIATIGVMAAIMGSVHVVLLCTVLLGSIVGFLVFNFHPAKIFMGDTGALFLGFALAMLSLFGFKQLTIVSFVTPLLIIGVPLFDTMFAIIRRLVNKRPIFSPDKGHLHHRLRDLGYSHRRTVVIIWGVAAIFGALAIIQSVVVQSSSANWVTFAMIVVVLLFLQLGAEFTGIIDKTRKPLLHLLGRVRIKINEGQRSK